jgi:hypothetical protein
MHKGKTENSLKPHPWISGEAEAKDTITSKPDGLGNRLVILASG